MEMKKKIYIAPQAKKLTLESALPILAGSGQSYVADSKKQDFFVEEEENTNGWSDLQSSDWGKTW